MVRVRGKDDIENIQNLGFAELMSYRFMEYYPGGLKKTLLQHRVEALEELNNLFESIEDLKSLGLDYKDQLNEKMQRFGEIAYSVCEMEAAMQNYMNSKEPDYDRNRRVAPSGYVMVRVREDEMYASEGEEVK